MSEIDNITTQVVNEIDTKMTINEFSNFVLTDVLTNSQYANLFDEATINNIKMLSTFSNKDIITKSVREEITEDVV